MTLRSVRRLGVVVAIGLAFATPAHAENTCNSLRYTQLKHALDQAVEDEASGLNLQMWATLVNRDGIVCAVAFSGVDRGAQWPGSRVISAQKANTGNAFSLDASSSSNGSGAASGLALSSANLYSPVQPGGSLFGLQDSNPVDTETAYKGPADNFGQQNDPMTGKRIGGINVFGGGLPLYAGSQHRLIGGVGVSGDTSCADHRIAWRVRNLLGLDHLQGVGGVSGDPDRPDNIIYLGPGEAPNGFKHPDCGGGDDPSDLPAVQD
jgi:uncharacterized protein GlcG (DUF336 family)